MRIPNFRTDAGAMLYKDTVGKLIAPEVAKIVIERVERTVSPSTKRLLDVACGPGTVSLELAKRNPSIEVVGTDYSAAMIRQCVQAASNSGLSNTQFVEMNANDIHFENVDTFDITVCNLAFPFFSRPLESMKGFYDSLRDGGHAVLSVPGSETWGEFFTVAEKVLGDAISMAKPFLVKMEQASKLPSAMAEAGFRDVNVSHHKIAFTFASGEDVLAFFDELFALLAYAPPELRTDITATINQQFPRGFTMHYEALVVEGAK